MKVKYEGVFAFKYSPRPNTPSLALMPDRDSARKRRARRLAMMQERQREIQTGDECALVGHGWKFS